MDPHVIATNFVQSYYLTFDSGRSGLAVFYKDDSTLIFEGATVHGKDAIIQKLTTILFQTVASLISTVDATLTGNDILVYVMGRQQFDNGPVMQFTQVFVLEEIAGSLFIKSQIFRLVN